MQFLVSWHLQPISGGGSEETAGSVNCVTPGSRVDGARPKKAEEGAGPGALWPVLFSGKLGFVALFIAPLCTFELEDTVIMFLGARPY